MPAHGEARAGKDDQAKRNARANRCVADVEAGVVVSRLCAHDWLWCALRDKLRTGRAATLVVQGCLVLARWKRGEIRRWIRASDGSRARERAIAAGAMKRLSHE